MAIYDLGTASLAANGEVTGVGTTWKAPLTLIRVGATIIFKTSPLKIYTISEIISDTQINVYNPNSETVPSGTGYAILAHDGITVQGLAQDVAETLRYYQSKETSIESLLQFIGQDTFDWPRFEQLANQSTTGAAEALASQIAAAESASTAVSARNTTTAARDETINAINSAGDAGTLVTLSGAGIYGLSPSLASIDWQQFEFKTGGSYVVNINNSINTPEFISTTYNQGTLIVISVISSRGADGTTNLRVSSSTASATNFRVVDVLSAGARGSRVFTGRESVYLEAGKESGGAVSSRVRGLLDVYSKGETFQKSLNFSDITDKAKARGNLDVYSKPELAKPTGAGFLGFDKSIDYETGTVGNALKKIINVNPDMYPSLQDAIDAAAALTGLEHAPSSAANHPDWLQPNTVSKVIRLNGKKYPISTTLHIHGDVSIDAGFGGVYLTDDFAADPSGYAVKCDKGTGNQYAGHISNLLIDARAKTVNGFKISDGYANKLDGIYVANVDGHGIHIAGGMGVHLLKFYAVGVLKPTNPLSTAHIVEGNDHQVSMGEGRYFRFGTWVRGGGNNRIDKVHNWGMYDDTVTDQNSRMKCCFVVQNSINNSFNQCFADSPSKWDYTKANLDAVDGYINGGIGFFIDGGATGNTFSQCQTFVNMNAFNDAGISSYTASLMPFVVGSINCSFIECENSNSPAWVARLINHIYSIDQSFTNILAAKNFVGIEYDTICNSTIFRKNVSVPVLVRNQKFDTPTSSYAPNFSDASYISATVTGDVTITPEVLTNIPTGYVEVLLAVYSTTSKTITFGANVYLASNTPSLTSSGTQVFSLSTTDGGATWFCKFESAYS